MQIECPFQEMVVVTYRNHGRDSLFFSFFFLFLLYFKLSSQLPLFFLIKCRTIQSTEKNDIVSANHRIDTLFSFRSGLIPEADGENWKQEDFTMYIQVGTLLYMVQLLSFRTNNAEIILSYLFLILTVFYKNKNMYFVWKTRGLP